MTVSKFGSYISIGLGGASAKGEVGLNKLASYSFAFKSHLLSLTAMSAGTFNFGGEDRQPSIFTSYYGILIGESIRMENLFFSISTGVSHTDTSVKHPNPNATSSSNELSRYSKYGISYPIELKLFYVARNGVGFGLHASKNFAPFYWGISIVFGKWNKSRVKN